MPLPVEQGRARKASAPVWKLIIMDMSNESSSEHNVPLIRQRRFALPPVANVNLNATPLPSLEVPNTAEEDRFCQERMVTEVDEEIQASEEVKRERERERRREEESRIDEEINRLSEVFEEEF